MKSLQMWAVLALSGMTLGCAGDDDPGGTDAGSSSSSSSSDGSTTAPATLSGTSDASSSSSSSTTDEADSSSSTGAEETSSSSGFVSSSSTGPGCELGTLDCACDGDACDEDLVCMDDVCETPQNCPQERSESNDVEADAQDLGEFNDFDPNFETADGRIPAGSGDEDWFTYQCDDNALGQVDMAYEITTNIPVRVCQFISCDVANNPTVTCPENSEAATSPDGFPGCCSEQTELVVEEIDCSPDDNDDSGRVFVRVDMPLQDMCVSYDLGVHC